MNVYNYTYLGRLKKKYILSLHFRYKEFVLTIQRKLWKEQENNLEILQEKTRIYAFFITLKRKTSYWSPRIFCKYIFPHSCVTKHSLYGKILTSS